MNETDQALTEAVAKAMWTTARERYLPVVDIGEWGNAEPPQRRDMLAATATSAVRQFDEQAALNCGHCDPNADEIVCACVVQSREDDDPFVSCPDCRGTGIVGGPDPACPNCGARGAIPAFACKIEERDDE